MGYGSGGVRLWVGNVGSQPWLSGRRGGRIGRHCTPTLTRQRPSAQNGNGPSTWNAGATVLITDDTLAGAPASVLGVVVLNVSVG